jgi:acetolactate synthase-1/2/3 large subunit
MWLEYLPQPSVPAAAPGGAEITSDDPLFDLDPDMLLQPLRLMPPPPAAIDLVASELAKYRLPVIVIGRRAVGCGPAIERLAEKLGAPVITSLDGKGIVDESHPNVLGVLGIFGYPAVTATQEILAEADVIVAIGACRHRGDTRPGPRPGAPAPDADRPADRPAVGLPDQQVAALRPAGAARAALKGRGTA